MQHYQKRVISGGMAEFGGACGSQKSLKFSETTKEMFM